ncbi:LacI family DNA-binding transcriptional regulator [Halotalea alkalilenta]|uniref:HTH lacI-type domain-containing protein n=1 Tax=Halotalea alkalilenta TaxID=376489 RepID=A0A172YHI8_9GAMM|nr:LacI family DNA-binding transcriptional regulator [Halotalea alkalilenta]ANF58586.1 hypothetical protein A5892_14825 [Halotalea alkalilenta]
MDRVRGALAQRSKRITIHEVAEDAGVSKTSVSRYLGEERKLLSETLQIRIEASIARLGFRPDRIASSLRGRRTRLIGMVVADITNPYTVMMMHGVETACRRLGYTLVVCNTDRDAELERNHLEVLRAYSVEGLVINTLGQERETLHQLVEEGLPIVLVDRRVEGLDVLTVGLDNRQAIRLGLDHLVECGFKEVLYITEPLAGISSRRERVEAFETQIRARSGQLTGALLTLDGDHQDQALISRLDRMLHEATAPAAVFCANAPVTLRVCQALDRLGALKDVGLIAIDEQDWSALVAGGITTLAQPTDAIGEAAMTALVHGGHDGDGELSHRVFPATLKPRGSTTARAKPMHSNA